jgi:CRP-like cAMP-binding protein
MAARDLLSLLHFGRRPDCRVRKKDAVPLLAHQGGVMPVSATPNRMVNRLLDRLPPNELKLLVRSEKPVRLAHGDELYPQDGRRGLSHVYFPNSGMISLTVIMENGKEVEAGIVGNEGMIGLPIAHGLDFSPTKAIAQISGESLRIPVAAFLRAMKSGGTLDRLVRRYAAFSLRYGSQTIACNLLHSTEQRMCRWLLLCLDRVEMEAFTLTHEFLAEMLGVRRQTVTVIAGKLQAQGVITYHRGVILVLNRKKLEAASCECYGAIKASYDGIML